MATFFFPFSAGASLNDPPPAELHTTIGPQFYGDLFLVVTLQDNNRHTSARAQKIFPIRNMRPLSIREPLPGSTGGLSTGSVPVATLVLLSEGFFYYSQ